MKNYLILSTKEEARNKVLQLVDDLNNKNNCNFAVVNIDFSQKENLIFAKRGDIRYTLMNNVDLQLFNHFLSTHLTKGKNLIEIVAIDDYSGLKKEEKKYFKDNLKALNKENTYLIVCSSNKNDVDFIDSSFEII